MEKEIELSRIGVSLPSSLLNKLDGILRRRGYSSRSEGIRDAIRAYILEYELMEREAGEKVGIITYLYSRDNHGEKGIGDKLTNARNSFSEIVMSTERLFLEKGKVFETVRLKGKAESMKNLAESIMSLKGVKYVKLATTHTDI
jgi:CopG family nickel-responsive transcriptional regulator